MDEQLPALRLAGGGRLYRPDAGGDLVPAPVRAGLQRNPGQTVRRAGQGHRLPLAHSPDRTAQADFAQGIRKPGQRHGDHAPGDRPGYPRQVRRRDPQPLPGGHADPHRYCRDPALDALAAGVADPVVQPAGDLLHRAAGQAGQAPQEARERQHRALHPGAGRNPGCHPGDPRRQSPGVFPRASWPARARGA
ncbi:hypothetical protein D3C76_825140 [compost metagenome]